MADTHSTRAPHPKPAARPLRWQRRKEARPAEIAAAALACFAEKGFAATNLADIAARAGVTKGTLYLYFASKEELLKAVVRQAIVPRLMSIEAMATSDAPARHQLEQLFALIPNFLAAPHVCAIPKLIIAEAGNFPDLARFYFEEVIARGRRVLVAIVTRGIARGEFRAVDPEMIFLSVVAPLLVGTLWQQVFAAHDTGPLDFGRLIKSHLDLLQHGLAPEKETA